MALQESARLLFCRDVALTLVFLLLTFHHATAFSQGQLRHERCLPVLGSSPGDKVSTVQEGLLAPETADTITRLVEERSQARWNGDYILADSLKEMIQQHAADDYEIILQDKPRKEGGGTAWYMEPVRRSDAEKKEFMDQILPGPTVLQLAHMALGAAVQASVETSLARAHHVLRDSSDVSEDNTISLSHLSTEREKEHRYVTELVQRANERIEKLQQLPDMIPYELGGRKAADAAFWFALAGCEDKDFLHRLANLASMELHRFCERPSCRTKDVLQILERFAAAGVAHERLQLVAEGCLATRVDAGDAKASLDLHGERSLLLIWKFSTKQKKQYAFLGSAQKHWERHKIVLEHESKEHEMHSTPNQSNGDFPRSYDWDTMFEDPRKPLVVDLGCGFGVSIFGLSTALNSTSKLLLPESDENYNFIGVDLGQLGIGYARGVAKRWGLTNTKFLVDDCQDFCERLSSYPGRVQLFLLQFPTPYRLNTSLPKGSGNSQLPASQTEGFMVTETLLRCIHATLQNSGGRLLVQSNVEDVAVFIRNTCHDLGFSFVEVDGSTANDEKAAKKRIPQRTLDWIAMGGERASGPGWLQTPILCKSCVTETEAACELNGTTIHRCILTAK